MTSVLILTEGGSEIGLGHVRRCMTLAAALQSEGAECAFSLRGSGAADLVKAHGFTTDVIRDFHEALPAAADAVVIDSYRIDPELFAIPKPVIVLDDLADRDLPVDVIVNPSANATSLTYSARENTLLLLGPDYALLRPEFSGPVNRDIAEIRNVMITLGGSDHGHLALDLAKWMLEIAPDATIRMIVGPFFHNVDDLRNLKLELVFDPVNMRELMLQADVAVSSGGQTLYELAASGTPALVISTAVNQKYNIASLAAAGTIMYVEEPSRDDLARAFSRIAPVEVRSEMSRRGRALVDGRGAERAA